MNFIALIRPYMLFFYLIGQTLYPLNDYYSWNTRDKWTSWQRLRLLFPTIFTFILRLALCSACFSMIHIFGESLGLTNDSITDLFLLCELLKAIAVLYQNLVYGDLLFEILQSFQTVEFLFQSNLSYPINFTPFKRDYLRKIGWAFGSYTMLLVLFLIYYFAYGRIEICDVFIKILQFVSISMYMNLLFFVDLITFYLRHLNEIITKENHDCKAESVMMMRKVRATSAVSQKLSKYKFIHYWLWKITQQISELFGWTLIALIVQSFIDFVYIAKWQLRTLSEPWDLVNFSRKNRAYLE